jgi:hypothetical protein
MFVYISYVYIYRTMWQRCSTLLAMWLVLSHTTLAFLNGPPTDAPSSSDQLMIENLMHRLTLIEDLLRNKDSQITTVMQTVSTLTQTVNAQKSQITAVQAAAGVHADSQGMTH